MTGDLYYEIPVSFEIKLEKTFIKSTLSGLRQFLAIENTLKMMKNVFYFTSKALFILKIFKFLSQIFFVFKFFLLQYLLYCPISQEVEAIRQLGQLTEYNMRNISRSIV